MKNLKQLFAVLLLSIGAATLSAQQVNTIYFLEDAPTRHYFNPAFSLATDGYLLFTPIGWTSINVMNNSLTLKDLIYQNTLGQTATFMNPYATPDGNGNSQFYNNLRNALKLNADAQTNILSFGFRAKKSYVHIFFNARADAMMGMDKDLLGLLFNGGMADLEGNNLYPLNHTRLEGSLYAEGGFGFSHEINEKVSFGFKIKYLYGIFNANVYSNDMQANLSASEWRLNGNGTIKLAGPFGYETQDGYVDAAPIQNVHDTLRWNIKKFGVQWLKPAGHGGAVDLGVTYKPIDQLTISLAVTDLGVIYWNKGYNYDAKVDMLYDGVANVDYKDYTDENPDGSRSFNSNRLMDTIRTVGNKILSNAIDPNIEPDKGYWNMVTAKINAGIDANFFNNQLGVGVFSQTKFYHNNIYEEVTFGLAYRPRNWFNIAASYSFLNGRWSNIGAGLVLRAGPIGLTLSADYIPLVYTPKIEISDKIKLPIPYNTKGFNLGLGIALQFGYKHDSDRDRVRDNLDICPNTPKNVKVDKNGCPLDSDGDGVPDYKDRCPNTPESAYGLIDAEGCPLDSDGDGVPDYLDRCPNTEIGLMVDSTGCPLDADRDGVPDHIDKCPGTPANVVVDQFGCPLDSDGDGVLDMDDLCPDTPVEAYGTIDAHGCPADSDGDGVPDYIDKCPGTDERAVKAQRQDNKRYIDNLGCEIDSDGDGVPDWRDKCIFTPGPDFNNGCPGLSQEVRTTLQKALNGIEFETASAKIKSESYGILDEVANLIIENMDWLVEIQGHTDSSGDEEKNLTLSQDRAESVKDYLVKKGIAPDRLTAVGFGSSQPVASNETAEGKKQNRRVVFNVTYEEVSYETIY